MLPLNYKPVQEKPIAISVDLKPRHRGSVTAHMWRTHWAHIRGSRASGTQDFTCERSDGKTVGVELTELLPRRPSSTAREPKSKRCNSTVRGGGGHRGEQKTPTQLVVYCGYRKSYPGWRRCRDGLSSLWDA